MKLLANIKMLFKSLKNHLLITFGTFLGIPLILSLALGNMLDFAFKNPITIEAVPIKITDNDNSSASKALKDFINNDIKDLFYINDADADLNLVIPKNYEESIKNQKPISIIINQSKPKGHVADQLKDIIDGYHENLYLVSLNLDTDTSSIFSKPSIDTTLIKSKEIQSSSEYYAISMLVFLLVMFMSNNVVANYLGESNGLSKRMLSMPIKRTTQIIYDIFISVIYSLIFVILYILINRVLNIAFDENLISLFIVSLVACVFVACTSIFISSFFSKRFGVMFINIIMVIQIILGGTFVPVSDSIYAFSKISPFYLINELFMKFTTNNNLSSISSTIFITLVISLLLFIVTFIKEKYSWREF